MSDARTASANTKAFGGKFNSQSCCLIEVEAHNTQEQDVDLNRHISGFLGLTFEPAESTRHHLVDKVSKENQTSKSCVEVVSGTCDVILQHLQPRLPYPWIAVAEEEGVSVLLLSRCREKSVQRQVFFPFIGPQVVTIHRKVLPQDALESTHIGACSVRPNNGVWEFSNFVQHIVSVVKSLQRYEICIGVNETQFRPLWDFDKCGEVDKNPYGELRYTETFRPFQCLLLVSTDKYLRRRCHICIKTKIRFRVKIQRHNSAMAAVCSPNVHLDRSQLLTKVQRQQKRLKYNRARIAKLKSDLEKVLSPKCGSIDIELFQELINVCIAHTE